MLLTLHIGLVVIARLSYFLEYRLYFSIRYESYEIIVLFLHHRRSWDGKGQRAKVLALEEEVINTMQQVLGAVECRKNMDSQIHTFIQKSTKARESVEKCEQMKWRGIRSGWMLRLRINLKNQMEKL